MGGSVEIPGEAAGNAAFEGQGPGLAGKLAGKAIATTRPAVAPPSRFPQKPSLNDHTTSGLDIAMQQQANQLHPVK